jgi:fibro-slime domain-containing protein
VKSIRTIGSVFALGMIGGVLFVPGINESAAFSQENPSTPNVLQLTGIVRDFIERTKPNGHTDFERIPNGGFGVYNGNIAKTLGADGKPVFTGGGWLTLADWKDSANRPICWALYDDSRGDRRGTKGVNSTGGIASAASFNQWFNDVPGVNMSMPLTINLTRQTDTLGNSVYVFDDKLDPAYQSKGGFFAIDGQLFGNSGQAPSGPSPDHNFHFTFELHTEFTYQPGQMFKFIGDDDVFVFIGGKLVIDLGGVHSERQQYVDLSRLGLREGKRYTLDFFYAERHRVRANCRIETNIPLVSNTVPSVTAAFD